MRLGVLDIYAVQCAGSPKRYNNSEFFPPRRTHLVHPGRIPDPDDIISRRPTSDFVPSHNRISGAPTCTSSSTVVPTPVLFLRRGPVGTRDDR